MKIGVMSYSYHLSFGAHDDFTPSRRMDVFEFLQRVKGHGYDGVQIDPMHLAQRDPVYLREVSAAARALDLFVEFGMVGVAANAMRSELQVAMHLQAPILRTYIGFNRFAHGVNVLAEIDSAIAHLREVAPMAQDMGIRIAVENHGDVTSGELVDIIQQVSSESVGVCMDLGNVMLTLEEPVEAFRRMAPYAITTHFKDYKTEMTKYGYKVYGVALGDGNINLPAAFDVIRSHTNLDRMILEIPVEAGSDEAETLAKEDEIIRKSRQYARETFGI